tara:strand:- start:161 stop:1204 length:1044 start_codon:yes stop_codon:yes gene_type:complete
MATRVEKILSTARLTLADPRKERWTDETLIAILNEAQIDFCQETRMLHKRVDVPILLDDPYFTLPSDCWLLTRVLYNNCRIPLVTHREIEKTVRRCWDTEKGDLRAIVYDRRNMLEGRVYPILNKAQNELAYSFDYVPSYSLIDAEDYGVVSEVINPTMLLQPSIGVVSGIGSLTEESQFEGDYGVLTAAALIATPQYVVPFETLDLPEANPPELMGIAVALTDYEFNTEFGVIAELEDELIVDSEDTFGVTASIVDYSSSIRCYYLKNPVDLVDINSEIESPAMYDTALKFYLCGQAFMNDIDGAGQQKGAQQMIMYERHVKSAKKDTMKDFTRAGQFKTLYRSGV